MLYYLRIVLLVMLLLYSPVSIPFESLIFLVIVIILFLLILYQHLIILLITTNHIFTGGVYIIASLSLILNIVLFPLILKILGSMPPSSKYNIVPLFLPLFGRFYAFYLLSFFWVFNYLSFLFNFLIMFHFPLIFFFLFQDLYLMSS